MSPDFFTSDADLAAIGQGVLDLTLPKPRWTHAAHFACALWLIEKRGLAQASRDMPAIIRAYNAATGVANTDSEGYHETITQASLRAAHAMLVERPDAPLFAVGNALMASPLGKSAWLLDYWSRPVLFSVSARRAWVDPDLAQLLF